MSLLKVTERLEHHSESQNDVQAHETLTLPFELRQKSRMRATLGNGEEVGLILDRGPVLRHGDYLRAEDGKIIAVHASAEAVSTVSSEDALLLARACYHLGNRHVPLQISPGMCRYQQDHVLDEMVESLGLSIKHEQAPFEPEAGAYHKGRNHSHSHDTEHKHHQHD